MAVSRPALDVADLVGEAKAVPLHHLFARRRRIAFRSGISPSSKRCGRVSTNVRSTSTPAVGSRANSGRCPAAWRMGQVDRGCAKTQRNFANDRAERNFSRFFRFQAFCGFEKANKIGPCENALEFSHSLDPKSPFGRWGRVAFLRPKWRSTSRRRRPACKPRPRVHRSQ